MALKLEIGSKLVAATHNPGKVPEIAALLDGRFEIVTAGQLGLPEPEETESTFVGNALLKARHAADLSGLPDLPQAHHLLRLGTSLRCARGQYDASSNKLHQITAIGYFQ